MKEFFHKIAGLAGACALLMTPLASSGQSYYYGPSPQHVQVTPVLPAAFAPGSYSAFNGSTGIVSGLATFNSVGLQLVSTNTGSGAGNLLLNCSRTFDGVNYESTPWFTWTIVTSGTNPVISATNLLVGTAVGLKFTYATNTCSATSVVPVSFVASLKTSAAGLTEDNDLRVKSLTTPTVTAGSGTITQLVAGIISGATTISGSTGTFSVLTYQTPYATQTMAGVLTNVIDATGRIVSHLP